MRSVPERIPRPPYVGDPGPEVYAGPDVQPPEVIEKMRLAGKIAAQAMEAGAALVAPGVTTDAIDVVIHEFLCDHGAYPATLDYRGFPKSCCTSVNEVICHGIPDARPLEDGDIVKIDVTSYIDGVHGDTCASYFAGEPDEATRLLAERTEEAMYRGIKAVRPGREVGVIGRVIEAFAKRFGYGVVREYTGHGVHTAFHSGLIIPHYDEPSLHTVIEPGMTFTVEPMLTLGDSRNRTWDDGWTVVTLDGSPCAQYEQTLVVTEDGTEILTIA
jgi:methionyl aminopeptidase